MVSEGFLEGNSLFDILETYLGDLVGDKVFEMYNLQFPVLVKLLDISTNISVQVHPDDEIALERYDNYGKEEFWHVLDADENARIYLGFKRKVTATEFYDRCKDGTVVQLLNRFVPVRATTSILSRAPFIRPQVVSDWWKFNNLDITFRLYDWEREFDSILPGKCI